MLNERLMTFNEFLNEGYDERKPAIDEIIEILNRLDKDNRVAYFII